jgi:hypothetical protein
MAAVSKLGSLEDSLMKILGEVTNDPEVGVCSTMGVVTTLELLQHFVAKLGHRDLLFCDPTYLNQ